MATARDMITLCLKDIGAIAAGETPAASEASDGLTILNNMLDRWSASGLTIFNKVIEKFSLINGQQSYTIGSGGDFDTTRPIEVLDAGLEIQNLNPVAELPVSVLNLDQWSKLIVKTVQSTIPVAIYVNKGFPLSTISVWPVPSAANKLVLYSSKPLTAIATLDTAISLPPAYWEAIQYNLDLRLAPQYGKSQSLSPDIRQQAMDAYAELKRSNVEAHYLSTDAALHSSRHHFNWLIGE